MRGSRGLTLIELAIVIIIIGILLGIGAGVVGTLIKRVKYSESKDVVRAAVEGIKGYANSSGRLPSNESELLGAIKSPTDAYGKKLLYIYDANLDNNSNAICTSLGTNLTVRVGCTDADCTSYSSEVTNVAFIVVSGDGNYNIQTGAVSGTLNTVSATSVYIKVASSAVAVGVHEYGVQTDKFPDDLTRTEGYDDIVQWVTLNELKTDINCPSLSVSITSPPNLPSVYEDTPYDYTLTADGGLNNKWGVVSGGTCDITNATQTFGTGGWLTLERDTGRLYGTADEDTSSAPGILSTCTATVNLSNVCVCADINDNNQCDAGEPYDQQDFSLLVKAQPVDLLSQNLPTAREDGSSNYSVKITPLGGSGSYTFSSSWDDVDSDGNPDYDHNSDGTADLEMCLDTNNDGLPDCSTAVNTASAPALIIHGTLPNNDPGVCQGELISFTISASSCSTSDVQGYSITIEDPDCLSGGSGGGGGSGSCSALTIYNDTGNTLCYSYDGSNTNFWTNNSPIVLPSGQTLYVHPVIFFGPFVFCSSNIICTDSFSTLLTVDTNNNCEIQLDGATSTSGCSYGDR